MTGSNAARSRRFLFASIAVLLALAIGELAARAGLYLLHNLRKGSSPASLAGSDPETRLPEPPGKILQPFLGYVRDPALSTPDHSVPPVNTIGFRRWPAEDQTSDDALTIVIVGGSFAERFSYGARENVLNELDRRHFLPGRRKRIVNYAMGGYKQPQQLAALTYLLSNGERPDIVINLDGFNEVVLSTADNLRHGINPFYPRMWAGALQDVPSLARQELIGELAFTRRERSELSHYGEGLGLRHLALWRLALELRDAVLARRQNTMQRQLEELPSGEHNLERYGPRYTGASSDLIYRDLAAQWARCSVLMAQICKTRGIRYFHFLQPNQYVAGSKPMLDAERRDTVHPTEGYGPFAVLGYPYLIREGSTLADRGVAFRDLTMIFSHTSERLYIDDCCHVNEEGNRIVGGAIAQRIAESWDQALTDKILRIPSN